MKKRFLLLLIILLPFALAEINIDGLDRSEYNFGDEIKISGYVQEDNAVSGYFELTLRCGSVEFKLPRTLVSLNSGERKNFPNQLKIPKITIPRSLEGSCDIRASLVSNNQEVDYGLSDSFMITDELIGSFNIDETRIQAGKSFTLTGEVFKLDNDPIEGSAEMYFNRGDESFLVDIISIKKGKLNYKYVPVSIPEGEYSIDVSVSDLYGNEFLFEDVASFTLMNELYVFAKTDSRIVDPGTRIKISGEATTVLQEGVDNANVEIIFGDEKYTTKIKDGKFEYELLIKEDVKSGSHNIVVKVSDDFGNKGESDVIIDVKMIPTRLEIDFDKESYRPGDELGVTALLYDQGDELVSGFVDVTFFNSKKEEILTDRLKIGELEKYQLDEFAVPGTYSYKADYYELKIEGEFIVSLVKDINIVLRNQTILITNVGNVDYKEKVEFIFANGLYSVSERISLGVNETKEFYLAEMVPTGTYNLVLRSGDIEKEFESVVVVGKGKKSFNFIYVVFAVVFLALLILLSYLQKTKIRKVKIRHEKEKRKGKTFAKKVKEKKEKRKFKYRFGVASKEDTEEFKKRVLRDIKEVEKKK